MAEFGFVYSQESKEPPYRPIETMNNTAWQKWRARCSPQMTCFGIPVRGRLRITQDSRGAGEHDQRAARQQRSLASLVARSQVPSAVLFQEKRPRALQRSKPLYYVKK